MSVFSTPLFLKVVLALYESGLVALLLRFAEMYKNVEMGDTRASI